MTLSWSTDLSWDKEGSRAYDKAVAKENKEPSMKELEAAFPLP